MRLRILLPFLPLLAALALSGNGLAQEASRDSLAKRSLELVNAARSEHDLPPLKQAAPNEEAAEAHADAMLEQNFYAHVAPNGEDVMDRYREAGGPEGRVVRENLSRCQGCATPATLAAIERMHEGWMQSPGHRENILAPGLTHFGFGLAENEQGLRYGVQVFAGPGAPRGTEAESEAERMAPPAQSALAAELVNVARRQNDVAPAQDESVLTEAAGKLLPDQPWGNDALRRLGNLQAAIPDPASYTQWQVVAGSCGGCGTFATDADVRFFVDNWLESGQYRAALLNPALSALGLTVAADGRGSKVAVMVLAAPRQP